MRREASVGTPASPPALTVDDIAPAIAELELSLTHSQFHCLVKYAELMSRWNSIHNLTSIDLPQQVLTRHLLDSLAILSELKRVAGNKRVCLLDVGSGGGLPGIPLAIAAPSWSVTLIDKVEKKVAFLIQAKVELELRNVDCMHANVEMWRPSMLFEVITCRAFASLAAFVRATRHLLAAGGSWCAMKGVLPHAELEELALSFPDVQSRVVRLLVPGLDAERNLIVMHLAR